MPKTVPRMAGPERWIEECPVPSDVDPSLDGALSVLPLPSPAELLLVILAVGAVLRLVEEALDDGGGGGADDVGL